ncbi:MAG: hypothetical protein HZA49_10740 [Planctomycetes bacterium]|nr:hypothetical protein [Planctomycetota bacterium]
MKVHEKIDSVKSREDFIDFLNALSKDFHDNHESWEHINLEGYFETIAAWLKDTKNPGPLYQGALIPADIDWKSLATIFYVGKIYE